MINRLFFFVSLMGMVLTLHLWIQKERNFEHGCWGISRDVAASSADGCNDRELKKYSNFLGISVAAWGYAFYFLCAALAIAKAILPDYWARGCHAVSEVAVALAFPFSLYLVGTQAFLARAFCPLCLISSALVATLFIIHVIQYRRGFQPIPETFRCQEIGYASAMTFTASGLLVALMIMVNQVGTRRLDQGEQAKQFETMLGRTLPKFIDPKRLLEMKPALYNADQPILQTSDWINPELPPLGNNPALPIIVFLDPNCPSCKITYATIRMLSERYAEQAQFHVISRTLWPKSELQSQALELAAQDGKYHEMWALQFERAKQEGLGLAELAECFASLGLDNRNLEQRLASVRSVVLKRRDKAIAAGIRGTPTIYIDGRAVANGSTDLQSLTRLIDQALSQSVQP